MKNTITKFLILLVFMTTVTFSWQISLSVDTNNNFSFIKQAHAGEDDDRYEKYNDEDDDRYEKYNDEDDDQYERDDNEDEDRYKRDDDEDDKYEQDDDSRFFERFFGRSPTQITQPVITNDTTPPVITVTYPIEKIVNLLPNIGTVEIIGVATDDTDPNPKVVISYGTLSRNGFGGIFVPVGKTLVKITAIDTASNTSTYSFEVNRKNPNPTPQTQTQTGNITPPVQKQPKTTKTIKKPIISIPPNSFIDTKGHFSENFVVQLAKKGVITLTQKYNPNRSLTRAEAVKMIVEITKLPVQSGLNTFDDINSSEWFFNHVITAQKAGIIGNNPNFRPYEQITRAEAAKFIINAYGQNFDTLAPAKTRFTDIPQGKWFAPYAEFARANKIINGYADGSFRANNSITRGEIAKILINADTTLTSQNIINIPMINRNLVTKITPVTQPTRITPKPIPKPTPIKKQTKTFTPKIQKAAPSPKTPAINPNAAVIAAAKARAAAIQAKAATKKAAQKKAIPAQQNIPQINGTTSAS